ncbi:MAG: prepilin-type N-terminal cleavage/methylation domain-containing protein [Candidatus Falkowbacteria bacterium]
MKNKKHNRNNGFTLIEILVSISLFVVVVVITSSVYTLAQRTYRSSGADSELWQNARVVLDRMSREIRQAEGLISALPAVKDDPLNPPLTEIEFQDGHDLTEIKYIKYYLDNNEIKRQLIVYYFDTDPDTYVFWNSLDSFDNLPQQLILEDQLVGEYFSVLSLWGPTNLINIEVSLEKDGQQIELLTAAYGRNL